MTHVFPCVLHITLCNNLLSPENPRLSLFVQSESCLKCSGEQQNKEPLETVVLKPELAAEPPGGLVSTSAASPQSSWFSSSGVCGAWEFAFPTGFQLMLLLLQGPHFENNYFKEITPNLHFLLKWITLQGVCFARASLRNNITSFHSKWALWTVKLGENTQVTPIKWVIFLTVAIFFHQQGMRNFVVLCCVVYF